MYKYSLMLQTPPEHRDTYNRSDSASGSIVAIRSRGSLHTDMVTC